VALACNGRRHVILWVTSSDGSNYGSSTRNNDNDSSNGNYGRNHNSNTLRQPPSFNGIT
jgi:hypothetical protein